MVAAAVIGSAVVGAVATSSASSRAARASNRATDAASDAASEQNELSRDQFEWNKQTYIDDVRPAQQENQRINREVANEALEASRQQREFSSESQDFWRDNYRPVEQQAIRDATNYDSADNIERRSGIAAANVNQQFSNARGQSARLAGRYGLASTAFSGQAGVAERAQALTAAGAQTGAAFETMDKAIALRTGATNLGRGIGNTAVSFGQLGNQSSGVASGAANSALSSSLAGASFMNGAYNNRFSQIGSSAGMFANAQNNAAQMWGNSASGWGSFTGGMLFRGIDKGWFDGGTGATPAADAGGTWT